MIYARPALLNDIRNLMTKILLPRNENIIADDRYDSMAGMGNEFARAFSTGRSSRFSVILVSSYI